MPSCFLLEARCCSQSFPLRHKSRSSSGAGCEKTKYFRLVVYQAICQILVGTSDNGKEFTGTGRSEALGAGFFFATHHSWERGLNEHTNGLVRQYFAKGTDFREVRGDEVRRVEGLLNGRPRKVLGYRTPEEVFKEALALGG